MTTRNELEWSFAGWTIDRTLHAYLMGFGAKKVMALRFFFLEHPVIRDRVSFHFLGLQHTLPFALAANFISVGIYIN